MSIIASATTIYHRKPSILTLASNDEPNISDEVISTKDKKFKKRRSYYFFRLIQQGDFLIHFILFVSAMLVVIVSLDVAYQDFMKRAAASKKLRMKKTIPRKTKTTTPFPDEYQPEGISMVERVVPVDADYLDYPSAWLSHRKLMKEALLSLQKISKPVTLMKEDILKPEYAEELKHLETLTKAIYKNNLNANEPNLGAILGFRKAHPVVVNDAALIRYLRTKMYDVTTVPNSKWRQHDVQLELLEGNVMSETNSRIGRMMRPAGVSLPQSDNAGEDIQSRIFDKYFKGSFHRKAFVQVGSKSRQACWERQIWKNYANWTGLVVEMQGADIEPYMYAMVAPFCVAPSAKPGIYVTKKLSYAIQLLALTDDDDKVTPETGRDDGSSSHQAGLESKLAPVPYKGTLQSLADLMNTLDEDVKQNFTHVVMRATPCFPLWSIMLAADMTDIDYLTVGAAGYAGKIVESLPFDKVRPKVVHIADFGSGRSTAKFLKARGYALDTALSMAQFESNRYGDFVFYKKEASKLEFAFR